MGDIGNSTHGLENYVFFILAFFAPKSTKPDRERVEMDEGIFKITISKCAFYFVRCFGLMAKNLHHNAYEL